MKLRLLTLFSIIVVLAIKSYTISAQDGIIDDADIELLTKWELKNKSDSISHERHVVRLVKVLSESPYIADEPNTFLNQNEFYEGYRRFKRVANAYELNKCLIHPSPIVRVYAHRAIFENEVEPNTHHLEFISNDSTHIGWMKGGVMSETTVMDVVTQNLFFASAKDTLDDLNATADPAQSFILP